MHARFQAVSSRGPASPRLRAGLLLVVVLAGIGFPLGGYGASASSGPALERLGTLPVPKDTAASPPPKPILIDPLNRRLYLTYSITGGAVRRVLEYDLSTTIPTIRRSGPLPVEEGLAWNGLSDNTIALDATRRLAYVLDIPQSGTCPLCAFIRLWDLAALKLRPEAWNLTTLVPNFAALGITYSVEDRRLYVVGTLTGGATPVVSTSFPVPMLPTAVVAIDGLTGALLWVRSLPECQHPAVVAPGLGASIFRSARFSALYIPCIRPEPGFVAATYPGQSALIRLWIDPRGGITESAGFRREVFPISGVYANGNGLSGVAVFDRAADRTYLLNQSQGTSGTWVFDGILSAWVGFVPAGDATNWQLGVDQGSGHMFMRFGSDESQNWANDPILVTDGRATPVPQGETIPTGITSSSDWIQTDPFTRRLFLRASVRKVGLAWETRILVFRDRTASADAEKPVDYDGLTLDVAEGPSTVATFQGSVQGFGARVSLVGGYGGILSPIYQSIAQRILIPGVKPSPRSIFLGRAAALDLSSVSAAASVQSVAPDSVTGDEYDTNSKEIQKSAGDPAALDGRLTWPWPAAVCIDAEQKSGEDEKEAPVGRSTVTCDLKAAKVTATTASGGATFDSVSLGGTSFVSRVARTPGDGTATEATAMARGVEISLEGVGRLSIGRVTSTVRTVAHGRPGTAAVTWIRELDGVLLTDPSGKVVFR